MGPTSAPRPSWGAPEAALAALLAVTAIGAGLADAAPSAVDAADVVWRVLAGVAVVVAASRVGPLAPVLPAAAAAGVCVWTESWAGAAVAGLAMAGALRPPIQGRWQPTIDAALTAMAVQVLFRLPTLTVDRLTTGLAVVACLPVLVRGWRMTPERPRAVLRRAGGVLVGGLALAAAPFVVAGALAWGDIGRGTGEAAEWRRTTTAGFEEEAATHLERATHAFRRADDRLDGWWTAPARLVPVVGHHAEAAEVGMHSGLRLVEAAQDILDVADPKDLQLSDGALDLDLVADLQVPLDDGRGTLADVEGDLAALETRWLLPNIADDVRDVASRVIDARRDADFADRVLDVLPGLLGQGEARRYFVVFSSPAETRELGGFLGNWGILRAEEGRLDLEETGRAADLNEASLAVGSSLTDPDSFPERYVRAQQGSFWQNVTSSPDLPTVARGVADLYRQTTGDAIDGVLVVDPLALAALLELTGPVEVPDLDEPLDADNAASFLLREQYLRFPERTERIDFLDATADATFDDLTDGDMPGPSRIADVLGPVVRDRHLLFWTLDPVAQPLLRELGLAGEMPPVQGDALAVARANGGPNKLDAYLDETIRYEVEVDEISGTLRSVVTATYTNEAPAGLPPFVATNIHGLPDGTNRTLVSLWTPHEVVEATLDGQPVALERQEELGRHRYLTFLTVRRGESTTLRVALAGRVPAGAYELTVLRQPLATRSEVDVTVRGPGGADLLDRPRIRVVGG